MASSNRKLVELFRAIGEDDLSGAGNIALQLSSLEEKKGHRAIARELRGALNGKGASIGRHSSLVVSDVTFVSSALVRVETPPSGLDAAVLSSNSRNELLDVVKEWKYSSRLRKRGVSPRSKLLFHGPPGCGKSLTASALGTELGLPVYIVRFDAVIGAYLGQTAIHLRQLFRFAESTPCVLLLDELDALGKRRGNPLDVGELDRIVISLMQELEHARPLGLVVGTTNLSRHLDNALWRRFDLNLEFKAPGRDVLRAFVNSVARRKKVRLPSGLAQKASRSKSFAAAENLVVSEIRRQVISRSRG